MEVEIIENDKGVMEVKLDNTTVAEVLRAYLNEQGIGFAAWKREHPNKPIVFRIESSGKTIKKAVSDAVAEIKKDTSAVLKLVK